MDNFRNNMIEDHHIRKLFDFANGRDIFNNVEIKGGVCYILWDLKWDNKCEIISHVVDTKEPIRSIRFLREDKNDDIFIRDPRLLGIKKKVENRRIEFHGATFDKMVSSTKPYGLRGDFFKDQQKYNLPRISDKSIPNGIVIYGLDEKQHRIKRFVPNDYPVPNRDGLDQYKIFIPRNYGSGNLQDSVYTTYLAGPGEICTETFVQIYPFQTKEKRNNCNKYMSTKFFRIMTALRKQDQGAGKDVYAYVPLQDFTMSSDIDWSQSVADIDRQLYSKYYLSDDEIQFIESIIKPICL